MTVTASSPEPGCARRPANPVHCLFHRSLQARRAVALAALAGLLLLGAGSASAQSTLVALTVGHNPPDLFLDESAAQTITFSVTPDAAPDVPFTVNWEIPLAGNLTADDFSTATSGALMFDADATDPQTFDVAIANDALAEHGETFTLTFSKPGGEDWLTLPAPAENIVYDPPGRIPNIEIQDGDALTIEVAASTSSALTGGTLTYVITVRNAHASINAQRVRISDHLDASRLAVSAATYRIDGGSPQDCKFNELTQGVTCDIASIPAASTLVATIEAVVGTRASGSVVNGASIAAAGHESVHSNQVIVAISPAPPGVTVAPDSLTVDENGGAETYSVRLDSQPTGDVVVTPSSSDSNAAAVSDALTFTIANWDTTQTVTVTGVDDDIDNPGDQRTATITHAVTGYGSVATATSVAVTVEDDDDAAPPAPTNPAPPTPTNPTPPAPTNPTPPTPTNPTPPAPPIAPALTASETAVTVAEGASVTWTITLDSQPTAAVTVTPSSNDPSIVAVSPETLTFTAANWDTPQTVTATGVNDGVVNPSARTATVGHAASGGGYNLARAGAVTVTVTDYVSGVSAEEAESDELPTDVALFQNYPNPFNPRTTIEYALPQAGAARLVAYDMLGQEVAVLHDGPQTAGRHAARFDASRLPNGAYIYRLTVGGKAITRAMTLAK